MAQANVNAPKGSFNGTRQSMTIGSNDQILDAAAYRPIISDLPQRRAGAPERCRDR